MRLATCALALTLASTTFTTQIADACGGSYGLDRPPQVMLLSEHTLPTHRTFVVMGERSADALDHFELLAPMSYDNTLIMDMGALSQPTTFTLVGAEGSRIVMADRRVALKHAIWVSNSNVDAMEISLKRGEHFDVALHGRVRDAKWHAPEWIAAGRLELPFGVSATSEHNSYALRANGQSLGTHRGTVRGLLEANGKRYIVMKYGTQTSLVTVPARS